MGAGDAGRYLNSLLWRHGTFLQVTRKAILNSLIRPGIVALQTFQQEYRGLLDKHGIDYERYLWG